MRTSGITLTLMTAVFLFTATPAVHGLTGDMDCNHAVDTGDIAPFALALTDPAGYLSLYPTCSLDNADMNGDLHVDGLDIPMFVQALLEPVAVDPMRAELAGNSLGAFPYFEFVKAFNEDAGVELAIDPTKMPSLVGVEVDVYVVASKLPREWALDRLLTDARPGGVQTITCSDTGISGNRFSIVGPYDLSSDAGIGLGVGYDIVIDVNQNGVLDSSDIIDGFGREAGFYVVHDTTQPGPLAFTTETVNVGAVFGIPSSRTYESICYPTNIESMGKLPLVMIAHGGGYLYTMYSHIQEHLASYGYIVVSHVTDAAPGPESASQTTLGHTQAVLDQQSVLLGGVLDGHIDSHRIIWIGHSRGGEGVVRAYDRVYEGSYTPANFTAEDVILVSSMAPTDFLGPYGSHPHDVPYCLWLASGDGNVSGTPASDIAQAYHLHDRAEGFRHSFILQGTGHAAFIDQHAGSVFSGPCGIGDEAPPAILLGYLLPLVKYYAEDNIPASDFFWRQHESFKPIGVPIGDPCEYSGGPSVVVTKSYHNGAENGNFVIDDFQQGDSGVGYDDAAVGSCGSTVTYTVTNLYEGRMDDADATYAWDPSDPMNGATQAGANDDARGVVFDWNDTDCYYQQALPVEAQDFTPYGYISLRAAQGTQHPYTVEVLGDLTFTITLLDGSGGSSSINVGAYGGGIEEPFQRDGGWFNEMETIHIRLADFLTDGTVLDLGNITTVRLDFGPSWGSSEGRLVLDDLELTSDNRPNAIPLTMELMSPIPEAISPGAPTVLNVSIDLGDDEIVPGSALLHYRLDGGVWQSEPLELWVADLYHASLPAAACGDSPEYYFTVEGELAGLVTLPANGAARPFASYVGTLVTFLEDDFETDQGWTVESDASLTGGEWERGVPIGGGDRQDPPTDYDGSGQCFLTENVDGNSDLDWGPTWLISPTLDMSSADDPVLEFAYWWANDDQDADPMTIEIGVYNTVTEEWDWTLISTIVNQPNEWLTKSVHLGSYVTLTDQTRVRIGVSDNPNNSTDEAGIDAVRILGISCE